MRTAPDAGLPRVAPTGEGFIEGSRDPGSEWPGNEGSPPNGGTERRPDAAWPGEGDGGALLDLRYRVVHPEKAQACLSRGAKPYLQDPATGARLAVPEMPQVGALRQTAALPQTGKVYFILFWNPGHAIRAQNTTDRGLRGVSHLSLLPHAPVGPA